MQKYIVTEKVAVIVQGVLHLTDEQVKHRERNLKKLGKGRYELTGAVQFKRGEEIGYEGDLPKSIAENLTTKDAVEAATKKANAEAEKAAAKASKEAEKAAAKEAEEAAKARTKLEADAKVEWDADVKLREQYGNDFNAFLAEVLEPQH
jgi:membrane protein involved in colicin uptake